jgi:hypothetical protein
MPVDIIDVSGKLLQLKVREMLKKTDYDRIIQIAKEAIVRVGKSARWSFLKVSKDGIGAATGAM